MVRTRLHENGEVFEKLSPTKHSIVAYDFGMKRTSCAGCGRRASKSAWCLQIRARRRCSR
jgi:hypothetical protein